MIFSVIKNVATTGAQQLQQPDSVPALRIRRPRRHRAGLTTRGSRIVRTRPEYQASNSDNDTNLQITNLPPNLVSLGGMLYVTEIYTTHPRITPLDASASAMPQTLYSIAYF